MHVTNKWEFGVCKRCLTNGVQTGDVIVRVYGRGWWHDACYRVVNPKFYEGLADEIPPAPPTERIATEF